MKIDSNHPRYFSLSIREKLVSGVKKGITSQAGLIAFGRGEAFDYLLAEETADVAKKAITAAAAYLLSAKKPIISVNGNTAALCSWDFIRLAKILNCRIEVNLFHYSKKRIKKIENLFKKYDANRILISNKNNRIILPNIASHRAIVIREGIGSADLVLVPLEDGDRAQALINSGKKVIAVDLNPLSRTAQAATVSIIDNIVRCLPLLYEEIKQLRYKDNKEIQKIISKYDNKKNLKAIYNIIINNLGKWKDEET